MPRIPQLETPILIEPFGLETRFVLLSSMSFWILIEPFGIETMKSRQLEILADLILIEPFGIETQHVPIEPHE